VLDLRLPGSTENLSTLEIPQTEHPEQDPSQDDKSLEPGPGSCEGTDICGVRYSEEHHGQHSQTASVDAEEVNTAEETTQVCQSQLDSSTSQEHERRVSLSKNQAEGEPQYVQSPAECDDCACALRDPSATPMLQCAQDSLLFNHDQKVCEALASTSKAESTPATQSIHHNLVSLEQNLESSGREPLGPDMESNKTMEMSSGSDLQGGGSIELVEHVQEPDHKLHSCSNVADATSAQPGVFEIQSLESTQRLSTSLLQEENSEQDSHKKATLSEKIVPEETQILAGPSADLPECVASNSAAACQNAGAGVEPSIADTSALNYPAKTTITSCEPQCIVADVEQSTKTVCLRTLNKNLDAALWGGDPLRLEKAISDAKAAGMTGPQVSLAENVLQREKVKKVAEQELDDAIKKKNVWVLRGSIDRARKADVCAKKLRTAQKLVEETRINFEL